MNPEENKFDFNMDFHFLNGICRLAHNNCTGKCANMPEGSCWESVCEVQLETGPQHTHIIKDMFSELLLHITNCQRALGSLEKGSAMECSRVLRSDWVVQWPWFNS